MAVICTRLAGDRSVAHVVRREQPTPRRRRRFRRSGRAADARPGHCRRRSKTSRACARRARRSTWRAGLRASGGPSTRTRRCRSSSRQNPAAPTTRRASRFSGRSTCFARTGRVEVADRESRRRAPRAPRDRERLLAADVRWTYGEVAAAVRELSVPDSCSSATARQLTLIARTRRTGRDAAARARHAARRAAAARGRSPAPGRRGRTRPDRAEAAARHAGGRTARAARRPGRRSCDEEVAPCANVTRSDDCTRAGCLEAEARVRVAEAQIDRAAARRPPRREPVWHVHANGRRFSAARVLRPAVRLEPIRGVFHYVAAGAMVTLPLREPEPGELLPPHEAERAGAAARVDAARLTAQSGDRRGAVARRTRAPGARRLQRGHRALARQNLDVVARRTSLVGSRCSTCSTEQRRYLDVERAYTIVLREAYEARRNAEDGIGRSAMMPPTRDCAVGRR